MKKGNIRRLAAVALTGAMAATGMTAFATPAQAADAKGGLDMTFWIFLDPNSTEDPRSVVLKNIVDQYNATNEYGNTVTVQSFNYSVFEQQAIQAAAAGNGPDVINVFSDQLKQHIDAGTVQPMTSYASDFISEMGDYIYTPEQLTQGDGEIYSLPWESRVTEFWYRKDVYDKAPETWDDMVAAAKAAKTDTALGFGLGLSEGGNGAGLIESFIPWIHSAGGEFLDENGKAVFNSDEGVEVVNFIKQLVDEGAMDQTTMNMAYDDIVDGFKSGTVNAMNAGTQRASTIMTSDLSDNFASAAMPGKDGAAPAYLAGQTLAIGKFAQNPDMSMDFIKYYLSEENQISWVGANCLPVRTGVYDDDSVKQNAMYDSMTQWSEYAKTGTITFYPADYTELCIKLVDAVQNVVFNGADAKTELDNVASWYNEKNGK
jgi:multiple sugar transport system substrate-binding protein